MNKLILKRLERALGSLKPSKIGAKPDGECCCELLVISESFANMGLIKRFELLNRLLMKDEDLFRKFIFIYEPVTPKEFKTRREAYES